MKILSQETNLGIGTTNVSKSTVVRLYNSDSNAGIVTTKNSSNTVIGSLTIPGSQVLYAQKKSTDTLTGSSTIKVAKTAYSSVMQYASWGSSGYSFAGVTDNLVIYYDAGVASSYSGSGTTWNDLSGSGINATLTSDLAANYSSSDGGYFEFTQNLAEYGTFSPGAASAWGTGEFSIEFWANIKHNTGAPYVFDFRNTTQTSGPYGFIHGSQNRMTFNTGTTNLFWDDTGNPQHPVGSFNGWKQYIIRRTGSYIALYINNVLEAQELCEDDMPTSFTESQIGIERDKDNTNTCFEGYLSIIRIYKGKGLSSLDRAANFNADKDRYGL